MRNPKANFLAKSVQGWLGGASGNPSCQAGESEKAGLLAAAMSLISQEVDTKGERDQGKWSHLPPLVQLCPLKSADWPLPHWDLTHKPHPETDFRQFFFQHLLYPWYTLWILVNYLSRFLGKVWSKQVKNLTVGTLLDIIIVHVPPKSCVTNIILQCSIIWDAVWWEVSWAWRKVLMNGVMSFLQEFGPLFSLFCVYSLPFHFVQWVEAVWGPPPEAEHCSWTSRLQNHEWK